ncbi:hypothetical protein Hanom_Chr04g00293811 [Helianthus anomalus]
MAVDLEFRILDLILLTSDSKISLLSQLIAQHPGINFSQMRYASSSSSQETILSHHHPYQVTISIT